MFLNRSSSHENKMISHGNKTYFLLVFRQHWPLPPPCLPTTTTTACHSHILVALTWELTKIFFRFQSDSRNPSCKAFHELSEPLRHLRFNLLRSLFWLVTAVRAMLVATIVADHLGAPCAPREGALMKNPGRAAKNRFWSHSARPQPH